MRNSFIIFHLEKNKKKNKKKTMKIEHDLSCISKHNGNLVFRSGSRRNDGGVSCSTVPVFRWSGLVFMFPI